MLSFPQKGNATPPRRNACARIAVFRRALTFLVAFTFLAQSFVIEPHIHGVAQQVLTDISLSNTVTADAKSNSPSLPDKDNCPRCRLAALVGSCMVPLAALPLPVAFATPLPIPDAALFTLTKHHSHIWQGRAPPR